METKNKNNDSLKEYFKEIKHFSLLTFKEELELSKRIMNGDNSAKEIMIKANLRLVIKIAKSYMNTDLNFLDIIQEGNMGLMKAAEKYDYHKNVRFSTYAAWWIKQSIVRALSKKRRSIRLPHRKEEALKKIKNAYNVLCQDLERQPTMNEIAGEIEMKEKDVITILQMSNNIVSLDCEINDDSGSLHDMYEDYTYNPDHILMEKDLKEETNKFLDHLKDREKRILMYRFSLAGNEKNTLKEIGDEMGISPETVRQIEIKAIKKLKDHSNEIEEYAYC